MCYPAEASFSKNDTLTIFSFKSNIINQNIQEVLAILLESEGDVLRCHLRGYAAGAVDLPEYVQILFYLAGRCFHYLLSLIDVTLTYKDLELLTLLRLLHILRRNDAYPILLLIDEALYTRQYILNDKSFELLIRDAEGL
jgi:hypothetical protein